MNAVLTGPRFEGLAELSRAGPVSPHALTRVCSNTAGCCLPLHRVSIRP